MTPSLVLHAALFALVGLALGLAHFVGLRETTRLYLADGARARSIAIHVARMIATAAIFVWIAQRGAVPLLSTFAGFLAARMITVARARREP